MRDPSFRCSLIGFFFLQGLWDAEECYPRPFYNRNGKVVRNVNFIGFYGVRVIVADQKLKAHVNYVPNHNKRERSTVCFTMPVGPEHKEGIYEGSLLLLPEVDVQYSREEECDNYETIVINFRYMHHEKGFKAVGMQCNTSSDSAPLIRHEFVLDRPFTVSIYYKTEKVLKVRVENLEDCEKNKNRV
ncbi:hypothetical protein AVEN_12871-1 [Araneus ventricosus]|uniref:Uncharacterized protein n=1 Tax=Araneus ventricosus TaxID=182803 RepID=A0A4Y1ZV92_ARAVE|nr:hypothetical protein AVEN_12871-1 [Araneus ventricosus]